MNKTSKKRKASKHKIRMFAALLIFGVIAISLGYNLFSNVVKIREMKKEKIKSHTICDFIFLIFVFYRKETIAYKKSLKGNLKLEA